MKWKLKHEDDTCIIYVEEHYGAEYQLFFDKERCTCNFTLQKFIYNENMFTPQHEEENEAAKWSAYYGHWQTGHPELDIELIEFVRSILYRLQRERAMRANEMRESDSE